MVKIPVSTLVFILSLKIDGLLRVNVNDDAMAMASAV
jgi:hypothetical protein